MPKKNSETRAVAISKVPSNVTRFCNFMIEPFLYVEIPDKAKAIVSVCPWNVKKTVTTTWKAVIINRNLYIPMGRVR